MKISDRLNQAALVGSFGHLDLIVNALPQAVAAFDRELRFVLANQQWLVDYHLPGRDLIGRQVDEVFPLAPDFWRNLYARALAGEVVVSEGERTPAPNGQIQFLNWQIFPWYNPGSAEPDGCIVTTANVNSLMETQIRRELRLMKTAESRRERAEKLATINAALTQAHDENDILAAMGQHFIDEQRPDNALLLYMTEFQGEQPIELSPVSVRRNGALIFDHPLLKTRFDLREARAARLWLRDPLTPLFIEDRDTDPDLDEDARDLLREFNAQALVSVAMYSSGRYYGSLLVHWRHPRVFSEDERYIYTEMGRTASGMVASRRAHLAEQSSRLETEILLYALDHITRADTPQQQLEAVNEYARNNGAFASYLFYVENDPATGAPSHLDLVAGWNREDAPILPVGAQFDLAEFPLAQVWFDHPEPVYFVDDVANDALVAEWTRSLARHGEVSSLVLLPLRTQGRWIALLAFFWKTRHRFSERDTRVYQAISQQAAPTVETTRLLIQTQNARQRAEILSVINAALSQAQTEADIVTAIAGYAAEASGVYLTYVDNNNDLIPEYATIVALWLAGRSHMPVDPQVLRFEDYPIAQAHRLEDENLIIIEDVNADPDSTETQRQNAREMNAIAQVNIPLVAAGVLQGVITVAWDKPHPVSAEERQIFSALMQPAAAVVAHRRAYLAELDARQETELLYNTQGAVIRANTSADQLNAVGAFARSQAAASTTLFYIHTDDAGKPERLEQVAAWRSSEASNREFAGRYAVSDFPMQLRWTARPDRAIMIDNTLTSDLVDDDSRAFFYDMRIHATAILPLHLQQHWIGLLVFNWDDPFTFTQRDRRIYTAIMRQTVPAIAAQRLYQQALATADQLRELDRAKDEFMSNMSHELRTPLNAIIGLSDVILTGLDGEVSLQVKSDVWTIFNAGQQLLGVVNDILDIAKIEARRLDLRRKTTDMVSLVNEAAATARVSAESKGLTLMVQQPESLPPVWVDPTRIRQVVLNLLSNAVKFSEAGRIEISSQFDVDTNKIIVTVTDEGIGIAPEYHDLIFQRFQQISSALSRKYGGSGLGLSISSRLVRLHNGNMWLESELGAGSRFYFSLPVEGTH